MRLLYGRGSNTTSSQLKKKLEAIKMWFYRQMLKIQIKHASSEEFLWRTEMKKKKVDSRKRKLKFFGYKMRIEGLENVTYETTKSREAEK